MELREAQDLALRLMRENLRDPYSWTFTWDNAITTFGVTNHTYKTIRLSRKITKASTEEQVTDTVLHEIAHANVGFAHGHGVVWKMEAIRLGARPNAKATPGVDAPNLRKEAAPWRGVCPAGHDCGNFWRKPRVSRSCAKCSPGKFNEAHIVTYTHIDTGVVTR